jgi:hypothetical protein
MTISVCVCVCEFSLSFAAPSLLNDFWGLFCVRVCVFYNSRDKAQIPTYGVLYSGIYIFEKYQDQDNHVVYVNVGSFIRVLYFCEISFFAHVIHRLKNKKIKKPKKKE